MDSNNNSYTSDIAEKIDLYSGVVEEVGKKSATHVLSHVLIDGAIVSDILCEDPKLFSLIRKGEDCSIIIAQKPGKILSLGKELDKLDDMWWAARNEKARRQNPISAMRDQQQMGNYGSFWNNPNLVCVINHTRNLEAFVEDRISDNHRKRQLFLILAGLMSLLLLTTLQEGVITWIFYMAIIPGPLIYVSNRFYQKQKADISEFYKIVDKLKADKSK
jgi:hypothetical protein